MKPNAYMNSVLERLETERKIKPITAHNYMQFVYKLNGSANFDDLSFLGDREKVNVYLTKYALSSRRQAIVSCVALLSLYKEELPEIYAQYYQEMMAPKEATTGRTEKQKDNWMEWPEVVEIQQKFKPASDCVDWNKWLDYLVVSLYVLFPPRRNEYQMMKVAKNDECAQDPNFNYIVISTQKFVFHQYKTAGTYGTQTYDIPAPLINVLFQALEHHPCDYTTKAQFLLVRKDGSEFTTINSLTRILNRIFGNNVGSTMLRHIYITHRYGTAKKEMKKDATAMGHSVSVQQNVYNLPF